MKITLFAVMLGSVTMLGQSESKEQISDEASPWWEWEQATGNWGGVRTTLNEKGVELFGSYTAEFWGNTTGGLKQGAVYTGLLDFGVDVDLEKLAGWQGGSVSTTWLWLSGRDASEDLVGNFLTISNISGFNTLRMLELWFQQDVFQRDDDAPPGLSIRVGQLTADSEFVISDFAALFLNGTFGWPAFLYTNIPNGGPGYPLGTLGLRMAASPWEWTTLQSALFQGNVFPQNVNRHGFKWDLSSKEGYFWINEAQVRWNSADDSAGLPGQAKGGAWFHTADFADPFFDEDGIPLADESSSGEPKSPRWNYGFYGIVDQTLYRESSEVVAAAALSKDGKTVAACGGGKGVVAKNSKQGLGCFGRMAFEPQDRNFVGFYFDTGLVYTGLIPTRDEDQIGIGFGYAQLTNGARRNLESEGSRGTGAEMVLEFTYSAVITPAIQIQPDLQLIINPGGTQDLNNALVVGGRATINF